MPGLVDPRPEARRSGMHAGWGEHKAATRMDVSMLWRSLTVIHALLLGYRFGLVLEPDRGRFAMRCWEQLACLVASSSLHLGR